MKVVWLESKRAGFVQVAYMQRLHVNGSNIEADMCGGRSPTILISEHTTPVDAQDALKRLMKRLGFGQVHKGG